MSRIVLASDLPECSDRVQEAFGGELNGDLTRVAATADVRALLAADPSVVAFGPDVDVGTACALAEGMGEQRPDVSVLLLTLATGDVLARALRAGVRDVIEPRRATPEQLRSGFERALQTSDRLRAALSQGDDADADAAHRRVIVVRSPKGGVGKTFVATSLAAGLAPRHPGEVVLVDLDLQFGDVADALDLEVKASIYDVVRATDDPGETLLKVSLVSHRSGLHVLCAPDAPGQGDEVTPAEATSILRQLSHDFRWVVVDTASGVNETALAATELSTDLVAVCAPEVSSVRGLRKELQALDNVGLDGHRRWLVVNRADPRIGIDVSDIEQNLGMTATVIVPDSRSVAKLMNQGATVLDADPRGTVGRAVSQLVDTFDDVSHSAAGGRPGRGLFRRSTS